MASHARRGMSRRTAVRWLGLGAATLVAGCTPMRILLRAYPEQFDADPARTERVLRAFGTAVVPGTPENDPHLTGAFYDRALSPLPKYRGFLAADLCRRASRRFGTGRFAVLESEARVAVIQDGLEADATTRRLYRGAILLVQVAVYAGIYDDDAGCSLIGFEGRYRPRPWSEITYPEPAAFLAAAATPDGNHG